MAEIDISGIKIIRIKELLKLHPREDVKELLVRLGIAYDLHYAGFIIATSLGEIKSDRIRLPEDRPSPFQVEKPT